MRPRRSSLAGSLLPALLVVAGAPQARACAVCFGAADSPEAKAMTWAILFMLALLACVLGGMIAFVVRLGLLARRPATAHAALAAEVFGKEPNR